MARVLSSAPNAPSVARPADGDGAPRPSPLARAALLAYLVLLVYGSLAPWQGWRSLGVSPFAFLLAPWPVYVTGFDLVLNVLAYLPLGLLLALALHPRRRGIAAFLMAIAAGSVVSISLETLQTYLPTRIASNLDVLTNVVGVAIGAVIGVRAAPALIDRGRLREARLRWFRPDATALLLFVALWPLAQIYPGSMLFGNGELSRDLVAEALQHLGRQLPDFDASQFAAAEVLVTCAGMLAAGAALAGGTTRRAPRVNLLALLVGLSLAAKAIAYGLQFGPERALSWLTPGAISGLAVGVLAVTAAAVAAPARAALATASVALVVLIFAVNAVPSNPYHAHWLGAWQPGRLRDVAAATHWLAQAWPYAMLAVLLWSLRDRGSGSRRGTAEGRRRAAS